MADSNFDFEKYSSLEICVTQFAQFNDSEVAW